MPALVIPLPPLKDGCRRGKNWNKRPPSPTPRNISGEIWHPEGTLCWQQSKLQELSGWCSGKRRMICDVLMLWSNRFGPNTANPKSANEQAPPRSTKQRTLWRASRFPRSWFSFSFGKMGPSSPNVQRMCHDLQTVTMKEMETNTRQALQQKVVHTRTLPVFWKPVGGAYST